MNFVSENVNLNHQTRETLVRARRWLINEGWGKGSMSDNGWCIAGAITAVVDDAYGEEVLIRSQNLLAHLLHLLMSPGEYHRLLLNQNDNSEPNPPLCPNVPDIVTFNDRPSTAIDDVITLFDLGISHLDNIAVDACCCHSETVIVVVDWSRPLDGLTLADGTGRRVATEAHRNSVH